MLQLGKPPADYPSAGLAFLTALGQSGYFIYFLSAVQLVSGLALLLDQWTPLFLVVLAPVTINILLFHLFLTPHHLLSVGAGGMLVFILNLALLWMYREHYRALLNRRVRL
jgi:hypothetical protein